MTCQGARIKCVAGLLATVGVTLVMSSNASAGIVVLGDSGWQASWHSSLDSVVDIDFMQVIGNTIFIQKSAEFTQGAVNGVFPSIAITFKQIGESSITNIAIEDEIVTNSTGVAWTGFFMKVMNGGSVSFNQAQTLASGGTGPIGFSIDPFTTATFLEESTKLRISGGVLANGESWYPGSGLNDGQLWIDVHSGALGDYSLFTLKERPLATIVPGPSALLAMSGLLFMIGRRRRRSA